VVAPFVINERLVVLPLVLPNATKVLGEIPHVTVELHGNPPAILYPEEPLQNSGAPLMDKLGCVIVTVYGATVLVHVWPFTVLVMVAPIELIALPQFGNRDKLGTIPVE
jgi:hypothetical protein